MNGYPLLLAVGSIAVQSILASTAEAKEQHPRSMLIEGINPDYMDCTVRASKDTAREYTLKNLDEAEILTNYTSLIDVRCLQNTSPRYFVAQAIDIRIALRSGLERRYIPGVKVDSKRDKLKDFTKLNKFLHEHTGYSYIAFGSYRGAIAEALVRSDYPDARSFNFAQVPALRPMIKGDGELMTAEYVASVGDSAGWERDTFRLMLLRDRIAECAARRDPESSHQMILSDFGSEAEQSAFTSVVEAISLCLPADLEMSIDRLEFRYSMASVFYRLAHASDAESDT